MFLEVNLTKDVKSSYIENYETLLQEIKEAINQCRNIQYSWTKIFTIIKKTLGKAIYTFMQSLAFLAEIF